jgi:hypothetical protein
MISSQLIKIVIAVVLAFGVLAELSAQARNTLYVATRPSERGVEELDAVIQAATTGVTSLDAQVRLLNAQVTLLASQALQRLKQDSSEDAKLANDLKNLRASLETIKVTKEGLRQQLTASKRLDVDWKREQQRRI